MVIDFNQMAQYVKTRIKIFRFCNNKILEDLMSNTGDIDSSGDLTPPDFCRWGYLESNPRTIKGLEQHIRTEISQIK